VTVPATYTLVRSFTLPDLQHHPVSILDYKQRQPVILVLSKAPESALVQEFADNYGRYHDAGAEVLMVVPSDPGVGPMPFPVLVDASGEVLDNMTDGQSVVLLLDAYNAVQARFTPIAAGRIDHDRILGELADVERKCPECGVPEWPEPDPSRC